MPAHAVRRRPAAPALLLTVAASALGALAVLPAAQSASSHPAAPAVASPALVLRGEADSAAVLARPPIRRPAAAKPSARPAVKRASRSRSAVVPRGYVCPVTARPSFTDTFGDPRPGGRRHQGTDVLAPYGSPVVAVISGVIHPNYSSSGGISLYLRGVDGDEYFYAHNSRNVATDGQHVSTGQVIAYVGNTGNARGGPAHVHFERHPGGGAAVDPYQFLLRACS